MGSRICKVAVAALVLVIAGASGCGESGTDSAGPAESPATSETTTTETTATETTPPDNGSGSTSTDTSTGGRDCGIDFAGEWTGRSQSLQAPDVSGAATASIDTNATQVSGSLTLTTPEGTTVLLDSGPVAGTIDCTTLDLTVADDALTLDGVVDAESLTFEGSYDALLDDGSTADFGTFTMTREAA